MQYPLRIHCLYAYITSIRLSALLAHLDPTPGTSLPHGPNRAALTTPPLHHLTPLPPRNHSLQTNLPATTAIINISTRRNQHLDHIPPAMQPPSSSTLQQHPLHAHIPHVSSIMQQSDSAVHPDIVHRQPQLPCIIPRPHGTPHQRSCRLRVRAGSDKRSDNLWFCAQGCASGLRRFVWLVV